MRFDNKKLRVIFLHAILVFVGALASSFIAPGLVNAQETDEQIELAALTEQVAADFDQRLSEIALQDADIQQLQARIDSSVWIRNDPIEYRQRISV